MPEPDWIDKWLAEDSERVRQLLIKVAATSGVTRKNLDGMLGRQPGYVSAVLTGRMELKHDHVTGILVALGIHPGLFFEILYPKDRPVGPVAPAPDLSQRLALLGIHPTAAPEPLPAPPPMNAAEIRMLIEQTVQRALAAQREAQRERSPRKGKSTAAKSRKRSS